MAEFQEVMRQLNRLCSHNEKCSESGCLLFNECGNIGTHCSDPKHSYRIEKTVMQWAAEHPEQVYPTWQEWFDTFDEAIDVDEPIPADIAEKLGLQPKEG